MPLLASHPAYNYLARRYHWSLRNLDLDPEREPDAQELDRIRALLREHPARILLWESPPSAAAEAAITSLGVTGVLFSPCESLAPGLAAIGDDYLAVQRANIERLRAVIPAR